jgi:transposase
MMEKIGRERRSESVWREIVARQAESGLTIYDRYAKKIGITHARCWVHCRRKFFEARTDEPDAVEEALTRIAALYQIEDHIREHQFTGENKRLHRLTHSKPHVEAFFDWIARQFERQGLTPTRPFTQALEYARATAWARSVPDRP